MIRGDGNPPSNVALYNNTIRATSNSASGIKTDTGNGSSVGSGLVFKNNIFTNLSSVILSGPNNFNQISTSDHDDFYQDSSIAVANVSAGPGVFYNTLASWQALGFDANISAGDPKLDASYKLQTGSAAIGLGTNLTSLGIIPLDSDKAGVLRPSTGTWDAGAYKF